MVLGLMENLFDGPYKLGQHSMHLWSLCVPDVELCRIGEAIEEVISSVAPHCRIRGKLD